MFCLGLVFKLYDGKWVCCFASLRWGLLGDLGGRVLFWW